MENNSGGPKSKDRIHNPLPLPVLQFTDCGWSPLLGETPYRDRLPDDIFAYSMGLDIDAFKCLIKLAREIVEDSPPLMDATHWFLLSDAMKRQCWTLIAYWAQHTEDIIQRSDYEDIMACLLDRGKADYIARRGWGRARALRRKKKLGQRTQSETEKEDESSYPE